MGAEPRALTPLPLGSMNVLPGLVGEVVSAEEGVRHHRHDDSVLLFCPTSQIYFVKSATRVLDGS
jgi:hypothetical protein